MGGNWIPGLNTSPGHWFVIWITPSGYAHARPKCHSWWTRWGFLSVEMLLAFTVTIFTNNEPLQWNYCKGGICTDLEISDCVAVCGEVGNRFGTVEFCWDRSMRLRHGRRKSYATSSPMPASRLTPPTPSNFYFFLSRWKHNDTFSILHPRRKRWHWALPTHMQAYFLICKN